MSKGTPPEKLLKAVRVFAREKFALQHRYAMALHTDQGHPHVHLIVKAVSEQGVRLNIRPPDPAVFTQSLIVEMEAEPYAAGQVTDGFEPAPVEGEGTPTAVSTGSSK